MDVAVIGAGRVGTAMAVLLQRAGHRILAVSGASEATAVRAAAHLPGVPVMAARPAAELAGLILISTPDDRIDEACAGVAGVVGPGRWVAHVSGASPLSVLHSARAAGAGVLAIHPLQTFPDVESAIRLIPGSGIAVTARDDEGFAVGERLANDLGGHPFRLADELKPLYHAAAVFASNYLVATTAAAEELFGAAGIDEPLGLFLPLARATLENVARLGPGRALTGPALRGDAGTIARNLEAVAAVRPELVPAYVALAGVALDLAERSGRLPAKARAEVERVLAGWR